MSTIFFLQLTKPLKMTLAYPYVLRSTKDIVNVAIDPKDSQHMYLRLLGYTDALPYIDHPTDAMRLFLL